MKPVTANLKILYQSREMWVWYFICGISIWLASAIPALPKNLPPWVHPGPLNTVSLINPVLVLVIFGFAVGRLAADVWTKPMFFCLPGQIATSMKILLLMGLASAAITSLATTILTPWMTIRSLNIIIALFSFYLMIYWLSVITIIRFNKLIFVIFLFWFVFFIIPLMGRMEMMVFIQKLLLTHSWASVFVCWPITCLIFYALRCRYLARAMCGAPWVTFFVGGETPGSNRYNHIRQAKALYLDRVAGFIDCFFSKRIRSSNRSLILPNLWGSIYEIISYLSSNCLMIFFVGLSVFYCSLNLINHVSGIDLQPYYFSLFGILCGHTCVIPRSDILMPVSRRGQLFSGITAVITSIFIMLAIAVTFVLLSNILSTAGNFTTFLFALDAEFISFNGKYIFFSAMVLPTTAGLLILFQKKSTLSTLSIIGLALFILTANLYINNNGGHMFNLFIIILITVLSFGFYLAILYFHIMKRSLC